MVRIIAPGRTLRSLAQERARVAGYIARRPAEVAVRRHTGDGITGPKALVTVAAFAGRLDEQRISASRSTGIHATDAYEVVPLTLLLICLRENDAVDGTTGRPVDIAEGDRVAVTTDGHTVEYLAGTVRPRRANLEVELLERAS